MEAVGSGWPAARRAEQCQALAAHGHAAELHVGRVVVVVAVLVVVCRTGESCLRSPWLPRGDGSREGPPSVT